MTPRVTLVALCGLLFIARPVATQTGSSDDVTALLQRQTQELMDAIATGDRAPWMRYLDDRVVYAAEDGATKSKDDLITEIRPFPKDIWGRIRVTQFRSTRHGDTAIANYISEEEEGYFGQVLHARYLSTDTWIRTPAGWRLAASQVLAVREDPPAIQLPDERLDEYVGAYALTDTVSYTIRREGHALVGVRTGRPAETLKVELPDCLFVPGDPRIRKIFQRDAGGRITGFVERRESWDVTWRRRSNGGAPKPRHYPSV